MRSRKTLYGEQKILELIDKEMEKVSNLDYSQIKEKIIINDEKGIEKTEDKRNFIIKHLKYALSIIILIASIITYCTICTLNKEIHFENNYYLTDVIIEEFSENNNYIRGNNNYLNTNLLSIMINNIEKTTFYELCLSEEFEKKYFCAYLDKELIDKVNKYCKENDIFNTDIYKTLCDKKLFIGIDMLLLKTYIYFKNTNMRELYENIKWIEYHDENKIKYVINNSQLIYLGVNNKINSFVDLVDNSEYKNNILIYNEIDFKVYNNYIDIENNHFEQRRFLCRLNKINDDNKIKISIKYIEDYCAEIETINDVLSVYINIPKWYELHIKTDDIILNEQMTNNILNVSKILNLISKYKIHEETFKYSNEFYLDRYYYDYNKIKIFLISQ